MIEIAPLAFMRGRTLNDSFIILDEAQNTSPEQMQMFLTRLGFGSRVVVTGDITQIDLPRGQRSGLVNVTRILEGVPDIAFVRFDDADVVRHKLVQRIVNAYKLHTDADRRGPPRVSVAVELDNRCAWRVDEAAVRRVRPPVAGRGGDRGRRGGRGVRRARRDGGAERPAPRPPGAHRRALVPARRRRRAAAGRAPPARRRGRLPGSGGRRGARRSTCCWCTACST